MIAVDDQLTAGTLIGSFRQGHLLPVSTSAACLTGIGRIDLHELPAASSALQDSLLKNSDQAASLMLLAKQWL